MDALSVQSCSFVGRVLVAAFLFRKKKNLDNFFPASGVVGCCLLFPEADAAEGSLDRRNRCDVKIPMNLIDWKRITDAC